MLGNMKCDEFAAKLASGEPVPGGGGASALCGALAAALCSMAARLTEGKKRFDAYKAELESLICRADALRSELIGLIDADAEGFAPLAKAYSVPKDSPEREGLIAEASLSACDAPYRMLMCCAAISELVLSLYDGRCSALLISDLGCAASLCASAAECAAMNIFVNTGSLRGDPEADAVEQRTKDILFECLPRTRSVAQSVLTSLSEVRDG